MEITIELGERTIKLIKQYFPLSEDTRRKETGISGMSEDSKLLIIRAEVLKLTHDKKGTDVKWMLGQFNAASVTKDEPLRPEDYTDFYNALMRYKNGEELADIFPEDDLG